MTRTQRKLEVPMMMTLQVQDVQVLVTFFDKYFVENFCFGSFMLFWFYEKSPYSQSGWAESRRARKDISKNDSWRAKETFATRGYNWNNRDNKRLERNVENSNLVKRMFGFCDINILKIFSFRKNTESHRFRWFWSRKDRWRWVWWRSRWESKYDKDSRLSWS